MKQLFQTPRLSVLCLYQSDLIATSTDNPVPALFGSLPTNDNSHNAFSPSRSANKFLNSLSNQQ